MLRIGGAAAIASDQKLAAGANRRLDRLRDLGDQPQPRSVLAVACKAASDRSKKPTRRAVVRLSSHRPSPFREATNSPG